MDRFEHFTLSVFSITHYWNKIATDGMRQLGMKGAYALYLVILAGAEEGQEITSARLAEMAGRDKADISRAISTFQKKGLVEPHGTSRYRAPIRLTDKGQQLADQIRQKANEALKAAGQGLSEEMRSHMYKSLDIIADNMKEICRDL